MGLELNSDKTKVMIFNKQGSTVKKHNFYYQGKEIEIVKLYTYLGFTLIPSGKKQRHRESFEKFVKSMVSNAKNIIQIEKKDT